MVDKLSVHSIAEAERDRVEPSDIEGAAGAAAGLLAAEVGVLLAARYFAGRAFSVNEKPNAGVLPILPEAN